MRKFTKSEIKKLKKYWKELQKTEEDFDFAIKMLEDRMRRNLKIKDLIFYMSKRSYYSGIGNNSRTIKLLRSDKLEDK